MQKRNRIQIYHDILSAINDENEVDVSIKPTNIQYKSNLSYNRLMSYIQELMMKGFIVNKQDKILVTDKGYEFLTNYNKLLELVKGIDWLV